MTLDVAREIESIKDVVNKYFCCTHIGDIETLQKIFHPKAFVTGSIDGQYYDWPLEAFLQRVSQSGSSNDGQYDKQILYVEYNASMAFVRARVVIKPYTFTDFITLVKIDDQWIIRHKSFTN